MGFGKAGDILLRGLKAVYKENYRAIHTLYLDQ